MASVRKVFESERIAHVYKYYVDACKEHLLPSRKDLNLFDIPRELPYLYISDVVTCGEEPRFKFRLMGTKLVELLKHEGTGQFIRELPLGGWEQEWRKTLLFVNDTKRPAVSLDKLTLPNELVLEVEHLTLPLSDDGKTVTHILGAIDFLHYDHLRLLEVAEEIDWSQLQNIEIPKRLVITNLAIDL